MSIDGALSHLCFSTTSLCACVFDGLVCDSGESRLVSSPPPRGVETAREVDLIMSEKSRANSDKHMQCVPGMRTVEVHCFMLRGAMMRYTMQCNDSQCCFVLRMERFAVWCCGSRAVPCCSTLVCVALNCVSLLEPRPSCGRRWPEWGLGGHHWERTHGPSSPQVVGPRPGPQPHPVTIGGSRASDSDFSRVSRSLAHRSA